MFKVNEIKENIKYSATGEFTTGDSEYRIQKEGKMYDAKGRWQSDRPSDTYNRTSFTCVYPESIEEAAKILDAHAPGWVEKVKDGFDLAAESGCILGKVFGSWSKGMKELFNINMNSELDEYAKDNITGMHANISEWQYQINLRSKPESLTFLQAVEALAQGKKVRLPGWGLDYIYLKNNCLYNKYGYKSDVIWSWCKSNNWQLVDLTFADINIGEAFKLNGVEYTKLKDNKAVNLSIFESCVFNDMLVVEKL